MERMHLKKILAFVITFMMLFSISPAFSYADTGVDMTAPAVNSLNLNKVDDIDASGSLPITIDITEDGCGTSHIDLTFINSEGHYGFAGWGAYIEDEEPVYLFTGSHSLDLDINNSMMAGEYQLNAITIQDCNGNAKVYEQEELKALGIEWTITVTNSTLTDAVCPVIKSLSVINGSSIDSDGSAEYYIELVEEGEGVQFILLSYKSTDDHYVTFTWMLSDIYGDDYDESKLLKTGKHKIKVPLNGEMALGTYKLIGIGINDRAGNYNYYENSQLSEIQLNADLKVIKSSKTDVVAPKISSAKIKSSTLKTPGTVSFDVEITEEGSGVDYIYFTYFDEAENYQSFYWNAPETKTIKSGKYTIKIPVSPFFPEGKYELEEVVIEDKMGNVGLYLNRDDSIPESFDCDVTLDSVYDMAYFGSASNKKGALAAIKALNSGETAVLDCRSVRYASEDYFKAIAGKNKILVLDNGDVQWVFDGRKVKVDQCKSIDLTTSIEVKNGAPLGFPDDKKVIVIYFADNGTLPGEAEVRINHDYIVTSYSPGADDIILSYMDNSVPEIEDEGVEVAGDEAIEMEIDHNSTFVLSDHKPRLVKPVVKAYNNGIKSIKLTWKKVPGAKNYAIYRATSKNGTYKKIKTVKKTTTTFYNKSLKSGKRYYYKVKALSGDKKVKSVLSSRVSARAILKTPVVKVSKSKDLKKATVKWGKITNAKNYTVYRSTSKNGTYKKIATTKNCKYIDKNVKKNKTYYYKVKANYKKSKYSSVKSKYVMVKMKK